MAINRQGLAVTVSANATSFNKSMSKVTKTATKTAKAMSLAFAGVITSAALIGAKFEQALMETATVAQAFGKDLKELEDKARQLGKTTAFTATQAASGMYNLASAGLDTKQIIKSVDAAMKFAGATASTMEQSTGILSSTLKQFNMDADQSRNITDIFSSAITSSRFTMERLTEAMKDAGATGKSLGWSLEQTVSAAAQFINVGLEGSRAGTALSMAMNQLMKGSKAAENTLKEIGLTLEDISPKTHNFGEIVETLAGKHVEIDRSIRLFGSRAGKFMQLVIDQAKVGKFNFEELVTTFKKAQEGMGRTNEMYARMMDTFKGKWTFMISAINDLNITFFKTFAAAGEGLFEFFTKQIKEVSNWIQDNETQIKGFFKDITTSVENLVLAGRDVRTVVAPVLLDLGTALSFIVSLFSGLPSNVIGTTGTGILGRILLGSWTAAAWVVLAKSINDVLENVDMGISTIGKKYKEATTAISKLGTAIKGAFKGMSKEQVKHQILINDTIKNYEKSNRTFLRHADLYEKGIDEQIKAAQREVKDRREHHLDYLEMFKGEEEAQAELTAKEKEELEKRLKYRQDAMVDYLKGKKEDILTQIELERELNEQILKDRKEALEQMEKDRKLFDDMFFERTKNILPEVEKEYDGLFDAIKEGWKDALETTPKEKYESLKSMTESFAKDIAGSLGKALGEALTGDTEGLKDTFKDIFVDIGTLISSAVATYFGGPIAGEAAANLGNVLFNWIGDKLFGDATQYAVVGKTIAKWTAKGFAAEFPSTIWLDEHFNQEMSTKLQKDLQDAFNSMVDPINKLFLMALEVDAIPGLESILKEFAATIGTDFASGFSEGWSISAKDDWATSFNTIVEQMTGQYMGTLEEMLKELGFASLEEFEAVVIEMINMVNYSASTIGTAFKAGLQTGDWKDFKSSLYNSLYNTIIDSIITAMMQSTLFQKALVPFQEALKKALEDTPNFSEIMAEAITDLGVTIKELQPYFYLIDTALEPIKDSLGIVEESTGKIVDNVEKAADKFSTIGITIKDLTNIKIFSDVFDVQGKALGSKLMSSLSEDLNFEKFNKIIAKALAINVNADIGSIKGLNEALKDFDIDIGGINITDDNFDSVMADIRGRWNTEVSNMMKTLGFESYEAFEGYIDKITGYMETSSSIVGKAFKAGLETGEWETFEKTLYESVYDNLLNAIVDAFITSKVFDAITVPFSKALDAAFADPANAQQILGDAAKQLKKDAKALKPLLDIVNQVLPGVKDILGIGGVIVDKETLAQKYGGQSLITPSGHVLSDKIKIGKDPYGYEAIINTLTGGVIDEDTLQDLLSGKVSYWDVFEPGNPFGSGGVLSKTTSGISGISTGTGKSTDIISMEDTAGYITEKGFQFLESSAVQTLAGKLNTELAKGQKGSLDLVAITDMIADFGEMVKEKATELFTKPEKLAIPEEEFYNMMTANIVKGYITGGPFGALTSTLSSMLEQQIGVGFWETLSNLIGDAFNIREAEPLRDWLEDQFGWFQGVIAFKTYFTDENDPFGIKSTATSFAAAYSKFVAKNKEAFASFGIDVKKELDEVTVDILTSMGWNKESIASYMADVEGSVSGSISAFGNMVNTAVTDFGKTSISTVEKATFTFQATNDALDNMQDVINQAESGGYGSYGEGGGYGGTADIGGFSPMHWGGTISQTGPILAKAGEEVISPHIVTILSDLVSKIESAGGANKGGNAPIHITVQVAGEDFDTRIEKVSDNLRVKANKRGTEYSTKRIAY